MPKICLCGFFFSFSFFVFLSLLTNSWLVPSSVREASGSNRSDTSLELPSRSMSLWKVLRTESSPLLAPRIRSRTLSTFYRTGKSWHGLSVVHAFHLIKCRYSAILDIVEPFYPIKLVCLFRGGNPLWTWASHLLVDATHPRKSSLVNLFKIKKRMCIP